MLKRNTQLEKALRVSAIILFICAVFLISFPFLQEVKQYREEVTGLAFFIIALECVSKVIRFYRQANETINAIWAVSIVLMLLGSTWWFPNWSMGIAGLGMVAFNFTLGYSFFANKPEIQ